MRIKKDNLVLLLLIFSSSLFILSCSSSKEFYNYLGVAKIDIVCNMAKGKSSFTVDIFSSLDFPKLSLAIDDNIIKYNKERYTVKLNDEKKQNEGYLHRFTIHAVFKELTITKLTFINNNKKIIIPIGRYTSKIYESSTKELSSDISSNIVGDNSYDLNLKIYNGSFHTYYLNEILAVAKKTSHNLSIDAIPTASKQIPPSNIQFFNHLNLSFNEHYYQVEGVLQSDFYTNLEKQYIYTSYYLNRINSIEYLQTKGIETINLYAIIID